MGPLLRFGRRLVPITIAALAISLGAACNAQVATVLATDGDAAAAPPAATCTSDPQCNDDPTISSLRGKCSGGVCVCNPGIATTPAGKCGSPTGTVPTTDADAGPAPIDPAFCSGTNARMSINGEDVPILDIKGKAIAMNCCDSGMVTIATGRFQALFHLLWRIAGGSQTQPVDVGTLTQASGSSLELDLGCDPTTTSCSNASAVDRFETGFTGTIAYTPTSTGMDTSYCLSVAEPAATPHLVLHTVQIYVPNLASPY